MLLHPVERLFVPRDAGLAQRVIGLGRAGHEFDTLLGNRIGRGVDITRADGNVLEQFTRLFAGGVITTRG